MFKTKDRIFSTSNDRLQLVILQVNRSLLVSEKKKIHKLDIINSLSSIRFVWVLSLKFKNDKTIFVLSSVRDFFELFAAQLQDLV